MAEGTPSPGEQLRTQWRNPSDIFSLLLIVGGDVVQKALSHTVGYYINLTWRTDGPRLYLTPVAFSFGWVAYAFFCLSAVFGEGKLMAEPDTQIQLVNCENGFVRENHSWLLGRLLRDHEKAARVDEKYGSLSAVDATRRKPTQLEGANGHISLKIDLFVLSQAQAKPDVGYLWMWCWAVIVMQLVFSAIPWIMFGNWAIFWITALGTLLSLVTGALPQWATEKWSSRRIASSATKTVCLTRGNGHNYAMVIIGHAGALDLETMATAQRHFHHTTRVTLALLAGFWIVLLVSVTGLTEHTWFLMLVGGIGMLQNVVIAAAGLSSREMGIHLTPYEPRPTITGWQYAAQERKRLSENVWNNYTETDVVYEMQAEEPEPNVRSVMGALMELEKIHKRAGAALLQIYFPGSMDYNESVFINKRDKLFWRLVYQQLHDKQEQDSDTGETT